MTGCVSRQERIRLEGIAGDFPAFREVERRHLDRAILDQCGGEPAVDLDQPFRGIKAFARHFGGKNAIERSLSGMERLGGRAERSRQSGSLRRSQPDRIFQLIRIRDPYRIEAATAAPTQPNTPVE